MNTHAESLSCSRSRLTVAMIVRDEQDVLAVSIESVRGLADEVVVLDTGSRDQSPELAARLGAIVHRKAWADDFSAARNGCLQRVSGDWVLWLDAGEQVAPADAVELRGFIETEARQDMVYSVLVEAPPREPSASPEQSRQLRLMPRRLDLCFSGRVRETLAPSLHAAGLETAEAPCRVLQHPRRHEPKRCLARARRDLALANLEAEAGGTWTPRLLLVAGQAHSVLGDHHGAREFLRRAIDAAAPGSPERLEAYYGLLTTFENAPELQAAQLTACLDSLEDFPFDMQLLLALGNSMLVRGRPDLAIRAFDSAVRFGRISPTVWHLAEVREIASVCLGLALQARQRDDDACAALEAALAVQPDSPRLLHQLIPLYRKLGKSTQAVELTSRLTPYPAVKDRAVDMAGEERQRVRLDAGLAGGRPAPHFAEHAPQTTGK